MMNAPHLEQPPLSRLLMGGTTFLFSQSLPLFVPLVLNSELSTEAKTIVSGALLFGLPEAGTFIAVSILGKPGYYWLRAKALGIIKRSIPTAEVGPLRYYIGLTVFCILLLLGIIEPYVSNQLPMAIQLNRPLIVGIADILFVANLFVLGGDFWDKLRALFLYTAKAKFIEEDPPELRL